MYRYTKSQKLDLLIPAVLSFGLIFLFHQTNLDMWISGHFYSFTESWIYRNNFILEKIFHKGGVLFTSAFLVILIGRWIYLLRLTDVKKQRDYNGFVVVSCLLTIIVVFFLKRWTTMPCPWNCVAFGGKVNPPPIWDLFSSNLHREHCFPGGHSSAGFAFLSMYFGYTFIYGKRNFKMLLPGLIIGFVFGMTQQARGAHFFSHDMATIFISILCSWVTSLIYSYYNKRYET